MQRHSWSLVVVCLLTILPVVSLTAQTPAQQEQVTTSPASPPAEGTSTDPVVQATAGPRRVQGDSISTDDLYLSGKAGIGTTSLTNLLTVNSVANPTRGQLAIKAAESGMLSGIVYQAGNVHLGFDTEYNNGWKAFDETVARLTKSSGFMTLFGSAGNTPGNDVQPLNPYWTVDLTTGKFGIGTSAPAGTLDVHNDGSGTVLRVGGTSSGYRILVQDGAANRFRVDRNGSASIDGVGPAPALEVSYGGGGTVAAKVTGNVQIVGNIDVSGNINAKFQDIAEWVPSTEEIAPGTVVIVAPMNHVVSSTEAYDTRVAGVVSARPGLSLGEAGESKVLVATTGRVKVRVDASNGAIREGDILVSSGIKGTAMKSEPMILNGRKFHQPGTVVGKALEPLAKGTGEILVLLSMQ